MDSTTFLLINNRIINLEKRISVLEEKKVESKTSEPIKPGLVQMILELKKN
jgi:hypothetical protein